MSSVLKCNSFFVVTPWLWVKMCASRSVVLGSLRSHGLYSLPVSVHRISQARILEWVAFPFSRGFFQPRDWTQVSCIAGRFFTIWVTYYTLSDMKLSSRWEHADQSGERMLLQGPCSLPLPARSGDLLKGKKPNSDIHHPAIGQGL